MSLLTNEETNEILIEFTENNLEIFKERLKLEWPLSICAYYFIENYQRWKLNDRNTLVIFYQYFNDTFIGYLPDQNYIVIYTCNLNHDNYISLRNLFDSKKINWNDGTTFGALQILYRSEILEEIKLRNYNVDWEVLSTCLFMLKDDALKLDIKIPKNLKIRPLTSDDSFNVNNLWPYNFDGSYQFIDDMIRNNGGTALMNENNQLMAWGLQNNYGAIGILQTLNEYRRNGYGKLISKILCKKIAKMNMDVCAVISDGNFSEIMLKKIGFNEISKITWIKIQ